MQFLFFSTAPYIKQCRSSDPALVDCLKGALHHLRPWLKSGIPEIQVSVEWKSKNMRKLNFLYRLIDIDHPTSGPEREKIHKKFVTKTFFLAFPPLTISISWIFISQKFHFYELFYLTRRGTSSFGSFSGKIALGALKLMIQFCGCATKFLQHSILIFSRFFKY